LHEAIRLMVIYKVFCGTIVFWLWFFIKPTEFLKNHLVLEKFL